MCTHAVLHLCPPTPSEIQLSKKGHTDNGFDSRKQTRIEYRTQQRKEEKQDNHLDWIIRIEQLMQNTVHLVLLLIIGTLSKQQKWIKDAGNWLADAAKADLFHPHLLYIVKYAICNLSYLFTLNPLQNIKFSYIIILLHDWLANQLQQGSNQMTI